MSHPGVHQQFFPASTHLKGQVCPGERPKVYDLLLHHFVLPHTFSPWSSFQLVGMLLWICTGLLQMPFMTFGYLNIHLPCIKLEIFLSYYVILLSLILKIQKNETKNKYISIWEFTLHFLSRLLRVFHCIYEIIATVFLVCLLIWKHVWCGSKLKKWQICDISILYSPKMSALFSTLNCYLMNMCWKVYVLITSWIN